MHRLPPTEAAQPLAPSARWRRPRQLASLLAALGGAAYLFSLLSVPSDATALTTPTPATSTALLSAPEALPAAVTPPPAPTPPPRTQQRYEVQPGDTLSGIFTRHTLNAQVLDAILAADQELLALDVLRPGTELRFERSAPDGELLTLSLQPRLGQTIHYRRTADQQFEFEEEITPSHWHDTVIAAPIQGSLYASAQKAGLSDADIAQAQRILEGKVDFRRDLRAGDRFELVLARESVDAIATGQTRIEAVRLWLGSGLQSAFLHEDGNYYDAQGESLSRAFLRYPMQMAPRVSSPFNLRRLHPVTRRVAPHHGVDFAMPTGTPVLSVGDGVVSRVGNHPYAGRYLEIEHPGQFKTRYLHLSRVQVKPGQRISQGERIALSGNTGRSTGPHLHFELHMANRPVDPLRAEIPMASRVPATEMGAFSQRVASLEAVLGSAQRQLAAQPAPAPQGG